MTIAYFDCFSGICGDMILGALFDLGLDQKFFKNELKKINLKDYSIEIKKIEKNNISSTDVYIKIKDQKSHRDLKDINALIENSKLDNDVKNLSKKIFYKLALAESKIHQVDVDDVHFHEVGAIDSIIDIIGAIIGLKKLNIKDIYCSRIPLGKGFVKCMHGIIPIPAPATLELLKNIPVYQSEINHELVTPTGAAIISTLTSHYGEMPKIKIKKIGYGAGKIKSEYPSLLRIILGETYI